MQNINYTHYFIQLLNKNFNNTFSFTRNRESISQIALITISALASLYLYSYLTPQLTFKQKKEPSTQPLPCSIIDTLNAQGIRLEKDSQDNSNVYLCSNQSFAYIQRATKNLPEGVKEKLGCFFYSPTKRSICCDLEADYEILYPTNFQLSPLIKASKDQPIAEHPPLILTDGGSYSEKSFIDHPLFKNTLEKYSVFRELCRLRMQLHFEETYSDFLQSIQSNDENWAEEYRTQPTTLAYLSLFAYLDRKITKEELFIIHMLSSAFLESPDSANYTVLSQDNVKDHLQNYGYLSEENKFQKFYCLQNLNKKSLIERTAISYQSKLKGDLAAYSTITERGGQAPPGVRPTGKNQKTPCVSICFFPPWLCKRLYAELYSEHSPPVDHEEFFGYRTKINDLVLGRPISYASPLFYLPDVHGLKGTQLSVTAHDLLYHCFLDWQHPHATHLIELGQKTKSMGPDSFELAVNILDRPVMEHETDHKVNLANHISRYSFLIKKLSERKQKMFFTHCHEVFGESVIEHIFSTNQFEQKHHPLHSLKENRAETYGD